MGKILCENQNQLNPSILLLLFLILLMELQGPARSQLLEDQIQQEKLNRKISKQQKKLSIDIQKKIDKFEPIDGKTIQDSKFSEEKKIVINPHDQQQKEKDSNEEDEDNGEVNRFLVYLTDKISNFELKFKEQSGLIFIIISLILVALMISFSKLTMGNLPNMEIIFMAFLIQFILNYYFVRTGRILPYIEDEDDNFSAKVAGFCLMLSLTFLIYAMQKIDKQFCILIYICSWLINIFAEQFTQFEKLGSNEIIYGICVMIGVGVLVRPDFNIQEYESHYKGLISILLAAFFNSYLGQQIQKLNKTNMLTLNHIFSLILLLFLPVFFPIEGLVSPTLIQWVIMIIYGLITFVVMIFFIRSIQLEKPSKILIFYSLGLGFIFVFDILMGNGGFGLLQIIGTCIIVVFCYILLKTQNPRIHLSQFFSILDQKNPKRPKNYVEMTTFYNSNPIEYL
eukprot:TRINITY_DN8404_c0_g1_i7.p1 TRINITY_DN8404_c0_g1~~TRINITY_DN8404_c0_g1_i7.p1  ORF type:complete len:453 (+),score=57.20 TRINITY_DN8404_c0_g1_i7:170-1528(+)